MHRFSIAATFQAEILLPAGGQVLRRRPGRVPNPCQLVREQRYGPWQSYFPGHGNDGGSHSLRYLVRPISRDGIGNDDLIPDSAHTFEAGENGRFSILDDHEKTDGGHRTLVRVIRWTRESSSQRSCRARRIPCSNVIVVCQPNCSASAPTVCGDEACLVSSPATLGEYPTACAICFARVKKSAPTPVPMATGTPKGRRWPE
jgi:hypothetical protein